jgi:hypothetical protein
MWRQNTHTSAFDTKQTTNCLFAKERTNDGEYIIVQKENVQKSVFLFVFRTSSLGSIMIKIPHVSRPKQESKMPRRTLMFVLEETCRETIQL